VVTSHLFRRLSPAGKWIVLERESWKKVVEISGAKGE